MSMADDTDIDHIEDYDELTAREIIEEIHEGDFTSEELHEIKSYERSQKGRVTIDSTIYKILDARGDGQMVAEATDSDAEQDQDQDTDMANDDTASDGEEPAAMEVTTTENDGGGTAVATPEPEQEGTTPEPETVTVKLGRSGYAAGHMFEDATETKEVTYNRRVKLAIQRGTLQRVG